MAVKAGQILFDAEGFIIDRIQTGGVNNLNITTDKIQETGDFHTVGVVRDVPDLSFEVQSLDVSTDIEALASGTTPDQVTAGSGATPTPTTLDFLTTKPIDVISPFRAGNSLFNIVSGVVVPFLNLEQVQYRYGIKANAEETFTFRGDAIYYTPGPPVRETATGGTTTYNFAHGPATVYHELGQTIYALSVWWHDSTSGLYKRLFHQQDYTDTASGFTLTAGVTIPATATVHYCYGTAPTATQTKPFYYDQSVNTPATVKPATIRHKDMDVYIGTNNVMTRLTGVQSFDATWKVTLQADEEFGNAHYSANDFNFADVSGTLGFKGVDSNDIYAHLQKMINVPAGEIAGALTFSNVQLEVRLRNPDTHALIKTLYIPDCQFEAPPMSVRANTKLDMSLRFDGLSGVLQAFAGERIGGESLVAPQFEAEPAEESAA